MRNSTSRLFFSANPVSSSSSSSLLRRGIVAPLASRSRGSNGSVLLLSACAAAQAVSSARALSSFGRITDEDRRWWLVHLECCPDVNAGTFVSWLDNCGTHTTKKLIERNVWTVEQVAGLSSDEVDELRYKEGCIHMDVVWEHARTVLVPLKSRAAGMSAETSTLHDRILELRKKRELERRRQEILQERRDTVESREESLRALREAVERKRQALRERQMRQQQQAAAAQGEDDDGGDDEPAGGDAVDKMAK